MSGLFPSLAQVLMHPQAPQPPPPTQVPVHDAVNPFGASNPMDTIMKQLPNFRSPVVNRTVGGGIVDETAPQGLAWLKDHDQTGGHSWDVTHTPTSPASAVQEAKMMLPQSRPDGAPGATLFNQYGHGSSHFLQPGETAQPATMNGAPMADWFAAHPQPNANVTRGDLEAASNTTVPSVAQHAQDWIAANSHVVHPPAAQAPVGPVPPPMSPGTNGTPSQSVPTSQRVMPVTPATLPNEPPKLADIIKSPDPKVEAERLAIEHPRSQPSATKVDTEANGIWPWLKTVGASGVGGLTDAINDLVFGETTTHGQDALEATRAENAARNATNAKKEGKDKKQAPKKRSNAQVLYTIPNGVRG